MDSPPPSELAGGHDQSANTPGTASGGVTGSGPTPSLPPSYGMDPRRRASLIDAVDAINAIRSDFHHKLGALEEQLKVACGQSSPLDGGGSMFSGGGGAQSGEHSSSAASLGRIPTGGTLGATSVGGVGGATSAGVNLTAGLGSLSQGAVGETSQQSPGPGGGGGATSQGGLPQPSPMPAPEVILKLPRLASHALGRSGSRAMSIMSVMEEGPPTPGMSRQHSMHRRKIPLKRRVGESRGSMMLVAGGGVVDKRLSIAPLGDRVNTASSTESEYSGIRNSHSTDGFQRLKLTREVSTALVANGSSVELPIQSRYASTATPRNQKSPTNASRDVPLAMPQDVGALHLMLPVTSNAMRRASALHFGSPMMEIPVIPAAPSMPRTISHTLSGVPSVIGGPGGDATATAGLSHLSRASSKRNMRLATSVLSHSNNEKSEAEENDIEGGVGKQQRLLQSDHQIISPPISFSPSPMSTEGFAINLGVAATKPPRLVPFQQHGWVCWFLYVIYSSFCVAEFTWVTSKFGTGNWNDPPQSWELSFAGYLTVLYVLMIAFQFLVTRRIEWTTYTTMADVRRLYVRGWFPFDVFVSIPYDLISSIFTPSAFRIAGTVRCLRVIRLFRLFQSVHPMKPLDGKIRAFVAGLCIVSGIMLVSLVWLWMHKEDFEGNMGTSLMDSAYWAVTTLSTTGYGDIVPKTIGQKIYCMLMMMLGSTIFGYIIGNLSIIMWKSDMQNQAENEKKQRLLELMEFYRVPWTAQQHVMALFPHLQRSLRATQLHADVLSLLPLSVQQNLQRYMKLELLSAVPFFQGLDMVVFEEIADRLIESLVPPGDIIIRTGEYGQEMYFIADGLVEVLLVKENGDLNPIANLHQGQFFGEITLFLNVPRTATVRAITPTTLFSLNVSDFQGVLDKFPKLHEAVKVEATRRMEAIKQQTGIGGETAEPATSAADESVPAVGAEQPTANSAGENPSSPAKESERQTSYMASNRRNDSRGSIHTIISATPRSQQPSQQQQSQTLLNNPFNNSLTLGGANPPPTTTLSSIVEARKGSAGSSTISPVPSGMTNNMLGASVSGVMGDAAGVVSAVQPHPTPSFPPPPSTSGPTLTELPFERPLISISPATSIASFRHMVVAAQPMSIASSAAALTGGNGPTVAPPEMVSCNPPIAATRSQEEVILGLSSEITAVSSAPIAAFSAPIQSPRKRVALASGTTNTSNSNPLDLPKVECSPFSDIFNPAFAFPSPSTAV